MLKCLVKIEQNCPVCRKPSLVSVLTSTSTWGYPDLDLRPAEMQRSSMFAWLAECPHCGYVSGNFNNGTDITEEFLQSDDYKSLEGFEFKSDLAKRFFKAYLIARELNDGRKCFFNLLHCAWTCDDAEDSNATEIFTSIKTPSLWGRWLCPSCSSAPLPSPFQSAGWYPSPRRSRE